MDKDTFIEKIKEICSTEDATDRISLTTSLSDAMGEVFDNIENLNTQLTSLNESAAKDKEHIDKLQKANMDLFLRVGSQQAATTTTANTGEEPDSNKRKFEDLFKE